MSHTLDLLDYRRQVSELYARARAGGSDPEAWVSWRSARDRLFKNHPQSPVEDRSEFSGLDYFPHDSAWRFQGRFIPGADEAQVVGHSGEGSTRFIRVGAVSFIVGGERHSLEVLWLDAYGGGVFIPFRDLTNGDQTYGGGRYLLDTVKGADLGHVGEEMVLDFNYAYHPSCVHSPQWSCPLAPPQNRLDLAVTAGERLSH